jgi:transcriptional regulator with GAF, ATPase, and Fis domain
MTAASCQWVLQKLTRLDAFLDGPGVEPVVTGLVRFLGGTLRPAHTTVLLCDPETGVCESWQADGRGGRAHRRPAEALEGIFSAVPADRSTLHCRDEVDGCPLPEGVRSLVMVPLRAGRSVVGALDVGAGADGFSGDQLALLEAVAPRAAGALRTAQFLERSWERLNACERECAAGRPASADAADPGMQPGGEDPPWGAIVGRSAGLARVADRIGRVAPTDVGVLITGESGTGKELVADEIHRRSLRCERPLIKVNCATVPRELYESEFFGHVKGAFTGAIHDRAGRFEAADGGTLLLDEVGEIPLELQGKLLRVLQSGELQRVGEDRTRTVDVRIVAATNKRLPALIAAGRFREDLFYRLNVFPIELPPLRERPEDIAPLAAHIAAAAAARLNRPAPKLTPGELRELEAYEWPGNVRELQNAIERALILSDGERLRFELPHGQPGEDTVGSAGSEPATIPAGQVLTEADVQELQRRNIEAALVRCSWKVYGRSGAAQLLGIKPTTLIERMRRMGIRRPAYQGVEKRRLEP